MRQPLAAAALAILLLPVPAAAQTPQSPCVQDRPIATPRNYAGWDRSGMVIWMAVEQFGGIVPDIEEDRTQAPPGWWRYPSPLRSGALLAAEARARDGVYEEVGNRDLKRGDVLVRTKGAGPCGKLALVGDLVGGKWLVLEAEGDGGVTRPAGPDLFDGVVLRPEVAAYRIKVRKDETLGHVRELRRDLTHLERTIAERPPLIARSGRADVDQKVHDLVDEAWSLVADEKFDVDRRELAGRALALGAALDWPGAAAAAAAVLDDVLRHEPPRASAMMARAMVFLLAGEHDRALTLAAAAAGLPDAPPRARYVLGRSLLAAGKTADALVELGRYLDGDPLDPRARRLKETKGQEPALLSPPKADADVRFTGAANEGGIESDAYAFKVRWPVTWRVVGLSAAPETGILVNLVTGRMMLDNGEAERGSAGLFAQRPDTPADRAATVKKGARNMFPDAKVKPMKPLQAGSKREHFREKRQGALHEGEVTTIERDGVVYFLVLNAPAVAYPKMRDEYAQFVKSFSTPKP